MQKILCALVFMIMISTASATDACMDEYDVKEWESKNGQDNFSTDLSACVTKGLAFVCGSSQEEKRIQCVNKCYEGAGYDYTGDCQDCFGKMGVCVGDKCLSKCAGGATADCKSCIGVNCADAFTGCSGISQQDFMALFLEKPQAPLAQECMNDHDVAEWDQGGKENFQADLGASVKNCLSTGETCYREYYQGKYDYTELCLGCFVNLDVCLKDKCLLKCLGGVTAGCKTCINDECGDAFTGCSGFTASQEVAMVGASRDEHSCISSAGYTWSEEKKKCVRAWEEKEAESDIPETNTYAKEGAECHGYKSQLICADGLICQDPKKPGLNVNSCAPGYCQCVVNPKVNVMVPYADACLDDPDQSAWNGGGKANFSTDLGEAVKGCISSSDKQGCVDQFYTKRYGYTEECSDCFGDIGECLLNKCLMKCFGGVTAACTQCIGDSCGASFTTCSGLKAGNAYILKLQDFFNSMVRPKVNKLFRKKAIKV